MPVEGSFRADDGGRWCDTAVPPFTLLIRDHRLEQMASPEIGPQRVGDVNLGVCDLLIRTSGEMRVSNYLLWQIAYAEIYVTDTLWPDFRRRHLLEAVLAYQKRERRYGGITAPPAAIGAQ